MCAIDDADGRVTPIAPGRYYQAYKTHKCSECRRVISPGERYHRELYAWEGRLHDCKTCQHCMVVRGWLLRTCGGWAYGDVGLDFLEHVETQARPIAFRRIAVGLKNRWRSPSGALLKVPQL